MIEFLTHILAFTALLHSVQAIQSSYRDSTVTFKLEIIWLNKLFSPPLYYKQFKEHFQ